MENYRTTTSNEVNTLLERKKMNFADYLINRKGKATAYKQRLGFARAILSQLKSCLKKIEWDEEEFYTMDASVLPLFYQDLQDKIKVKYNWEYAFRLYFESLGLNIEPLGKIDFTGTSVTKYQNQILFEEDVASDKTVYIQKQQINSEGYQIMTTDGVIDCLSLNVAVQLFTDSKAVLSIQKKSVANGLTS